MKIKKIIAGAFIASTIALGFAPEANALPQDDVLCSSNMAYRTGHPVVCKDIGINSHGGGGGMNYPTSGGHPCPLLHILGLA